MRFARLLAFVSCLSLLSLLGPPPAAALDLPGLSGDASVYENRLLEKAPPQENATARDAALARARTAAGAKNWPAAVTAYEQAIQQGDRSPATWLALSEAFEQSAATPNQQAANQQANLQRALHAAFLSYRYATTAQDNGAALQRIGRILEARLNRPVQALEAYKEALQLTPSAPGLGEKVFALRRAIGLQLTAVKVDPESEPPGVCAEFGDELSQKRDVQFADFVRVNPSPGIAVEPRGSSLCISGLEHGRTYTLELREGLPGADGLILKKTETQTVRVGNRRPTAVFPGKTFILPPVGDGLPLVTVNLEEVAVKVYRINDRNLAGSINRQELMSTLDRYSAGEIADQQGELVWDGKMRVEQPQRNKSVRTAFPIGRVVDRRKPGIYVVTAEAADGVPGERDWSLIGTQWVVVSDIGLTTFSGRDGLHVFVRSLESAQPLGGVSLALVARNNEELARTATDPSGHVRFEPGLMRGKGGNAPVAVMAYTDGGDYMLLDLTNAAFDLSDRGVSGRVSPGPLDAFLYTDRGVYRPGETVHLAALLRDDRVAAVEDMPLTLKVLRPNGTAFKTVVVKGENAGGAVTQVPLTTTAPLGSWTVEARVEPTGEPIGRLSFQVEEFVPERLKVELSAAAPMLTPVQPVDVVATSRFLYGPPAAGLDGTAEMTIEPDPNPFPAHPGYRFGLVQERFSPRLTELAFPTTDANGVSRTTLRLAAPPDTTLPLRATVRVAVSEPGGRPTRESMSVPVRVHPHLIGIRPQFENASVDEGSEAVFDVIAVDAAGKPVATPELRYELIRERVTYQLVTGEGTARYEIVTRDERVRNGTLTISADQPFRIAERVPYGRYRLEVFHAGSGIATSVRFSAGWQMSQDAGDRPDRAEVVLEKPSYAPGETARVHVRAPFAGEALITLAADRVHSYRLVSIPAEGATIEIPVEADWGAGAYVTASVFRPLVKDQPRAPVRAIGLAWMAVDAAAHALAVEMTVPDRVQPRRPATIPVKVAGADPGSQIFLTLAAVDEGILQLTDFVTPDPKDHYLGKRQLSVDIRDDYGRLIEWTGAPVGNIRQGGDGGLGKSLPVVPTRTVALFAGPVRLNDDGTTTVTLDIPDFNGQLRLMAVAYDRSRVGSGEARLFVRDDLVADVILPRFLAPGDESRLTLSLHNVGGQAGNYRVALSTRGPATVDVNGPVEADLAQGERRTVGLGLRANGAGIATIALHATGPGGFDVTRDWQITVRPARPTDTQFTTQQLPPGNSFRAQSALLASFVPGTTGLSLSYGTAPRIDVPGLMQALDRWAYGCLEQTTSRAFPLLDSVGAEVLKGSRREAFDRAVEVDGAVIRVLDMQRYDGVFGLWTPYDGDSWVSAYAMEFLTRARAAGHAVPDAPYQAGLQALREMVEEGGTEAAELAARTYALYVLALADAARMPQLRYFHDALLEKLPTPIAKGQLAAALARAGDRERATAAMTAAMANLARKTWTVDYGSAPRDAAALIVLVDESGLLRERLPELVDQLPIGQNIADRTSTQEQAWMVRAAFSLQRPGGMSLSVNERQIAAADPTFIVPPMTDLVSGMTVRNSGTAPVWQGLTVYGVPSVAQPAARNGFRISRKFLNRDGTPTNLDAVKQNDVFVVLVEGDASTQIEHQALIEHALPAGWEIENARLGAGGVGDLPWIGELTEPRAIEARDDRFAAAVDLTADSNKFRFAFLVRAVTPGRYELPGAQVIDMYKPRFFARQAAGRIAVLP